MGGKSTNFNACSSDGKSPAVTPDQFLMVLNLQLNGNTIPEKMRSDIQTQIDKSPALAKLQQEIGPCPAGTAGDVINKYQMTGWANLSTGVVRPDPNDLNRLSLQAHNILTMNGIEDNGDASRNLSGAAIGWAMNANKPALTSSPAHTRTVERDPLKGFSTFGVPTGTPAPEPEKPVTGIYYDAPKR